MEYYIKKNDVVSLLMKEAKSHDLSFSAEAYERAANLIACMPNEDVQPVKHGEWEMFYQNGKPKLKCTNCHSLFDIRTNDKHICIYPKFCEECGADMRGDPDV